MPQSFPILRSGSDRNGPYRLLGSNHLRSKESAMDWKLELVAVPVSDVDRAKSFYVDQVGFVADVDQTVSDEIRFVQLTPRGSACSIAFGRGIVDSAPGSLKGMQIVVAD